MRQIASAAFAAVVAVLLATGCAPEPAPTPSPTGFASEEEAFAAAEATYRAYVDAVSAVQTGRAGTDPSEFLIGQALDEEIASARELAASGKRLEGPVGVASVSAVEATSSVATIQACLDLSRSRVVTTSGEDVTPLSRPGSFSVEIGAIWTPNGVLINSSKPSTLSC